MCESEYPPRLNEFPCTQWPNAKRIRLGPLGTMNISRCPQPGTTRSNLQGTMDNTFVSSEGWLPVRLIPAPYMTRFSLYSPVQAQD